MKSHVSCPNLSLFPTPPKAPLHQSTVPQTLSNSIVLPTVNTKQEAIMERPDPPIVEAEVKVEAPPRVKPLTLDKMRGKRDSMMILYHGAMSYVARGNNYSTSGDQGISI